MGFLKKIGKSLFGLSRSLTSKKTGSRKTCKARPKKIKKVKGKPVRKITKKCRLPARTKTGKKKIIRGKKRPGLVKEALAVLPMAEVTHYFPHVHAAVLKIKVGDIRIGDELHFKGHTTDFVQRVMSMQIDHKPVAIATKGDDFGLEVKSRVRAGDLVYKKK